MSLSMLKRKRGSQAAIISRLRQRGELIILSNGSRTGLLEVLKEVDEALTGCIEMNAEYVEALALDDAEKQRAAVYEEKVKADCEIFRASVTQYLQRRAGEAPSVVSEASAVPSATSAHSQAAAEVELQVKQKETQQLKQRLSMQREKRDLEDKLLLQVKEDEVEAARLRAELWKKTEHPLEWERRNDFEPEDRCKESDKQGHMNSQIEQQRGARAATEQVSTANSHIDHSLPRLTLPVFSGDVVEWPRWYTLYKLLVHDKPISKQQKMIHLQSAVAGRARNLIGIMTFEEDSYEKALQTLQERYGQEIDVAHAVLSKMFTCPPPKELDVASLEHFQGVVHMAVSTLQQLGYTADLQSQENLRRLVEHMPVELRRSWTEHSIELRPPSLGDLDQWLQSRLRIALRMRTQTQAHRTGSARQTRQAHATATVPAKQVCVCCFDSHSLYNCEKFKALSVPERMKFVADNKCCISCLRKGHRMKQCWFARKCGITGCALMHNKLLHGQQRNISGPSTEHPIEPQVQSERPATARSSRFVAATNTRENTSRVLLQVVPVRVHGEHGEYRDTLAILDMGADTSLCSDKLLTELGIRGETQSLALQTVDGLGAQRSTQKVQLTLTPLAACEEGTPPVVISEVFSVNNIHVRTPVISRKCLKTWRHLRDIELPNYAGKTVEVLIGAPVTQALLQREVRVGKPGQPVAIRTAFGWALSGAVSQLAASSERTVMHVVHDDGEDDLTKHLREWWCTDSFGTTGQVKRPTSREDAKALKTLQATTRRNGSRYEAGLLWKQDAVSFPDNYSMAEGRLKSLERNLERNPERRAAYQEAIEAYMEKGYARKIGADEEQCTKRWYLPHHAVVHPTKDKLRVVFDASAAYKNTSLNSELLTGPDLLHSLNEILLRFREEPVGMAADVEKMFLQIAIRSEDQPSLSFLWRRRSGLEIERYQMKVLIFGARCSPAIANYVLHRIAEDCAQADERSATTAITNNFYADDFLRSEATAEEAIKTRKVVTSVVARGGFVLRKWISNRREVIEETPEGDREVHGEIHKVLGCVWNTSEDSLCVEVPNNQVPKTKRGVLQLMARTFDPLGIAAPFCLQAKAFMQHLWTQKYGWDEPLNETDLRVWEEWVKGLPCLSGLSVPRCLKPVNEVPLSLELHIFVDASTKAFAAVAYVKTVYAGGVHVALLMARTRVAPLKGLTIVRLELQAAVLGVRLKNAVVDSLSYRFERCIFWTDSEAVLKYIRNETRRFKIFVANRVSEILDSSTSNQWRHVPGKLNPADLASRGACTEELQQADAWWNGPAFLKEEQDYNVQIEVDELDTHDAELKGERVVRCVQTSTRTEAHLVDPTRFSSWNRYRRVMGWCLRFVNNLRASVKRTMSTTEGPLSLPEVEEAVKRIFRRDQEIHRECIETSETFKDKAEILRLRGRLSRAPLAETSRNPIVLAKESGLVRLLVTNAHNQVMHSGVSHTQNRFREDYWTPKLRTTVKKILRGCVFCRNRRSKPRQPIMADLPDIRFDQTRPFSSVGLDYFGPLEVHKGRKVEKRYVLLVTCLATRALHLEVAYSLETDCFLMALRRFIARRGAPKLIASDNGTNLVGGERELRRAVQEWNQQQITEELIQKGIEWRFNPPLASHMGGVWERLVGSVKRALRVVLGHQKCTDDVLQTVLAEVEFMVNSRPLTYVSGDAGDPESITPNHFLLGVHPSDVGLPPGVFYDKDIHHRRKWFQCQGLAEQLWQRWRKEYLPTLARRTKWKKSEENLQVGDVVLLSDRDVPRSHWPLAVVEKVFPGPDEVVRTVEIRTTRGSYRRPVNKLCVLENASIN